jgi:transmembrane sensor
MSELDVPIKRSLREPQLPLEQLWTQIDAKRARGPIGRWVQFGSFAGALSGAFVLAAVAVLYLVPRAEMRVAEGPLLRANGDLVGVLDTSSSGAALDVVLSDGSRIRVEPGARLVAERSDGRQFRAVVQQGKIVFDVKPGGPRRWTIDAGDTRVVVIGTRFSVTRDDARVSVAVERGKVEVRGARVPQGVQALGAGERLAIAPVPPVATASEKSEMPPAAPVEAHEPAPRNERASAASTEQTPDQLLKAADAARAAGDYRRAARSLQRFLAAYPSDPQAAIVALTLGRLQLEQLGVPKAAVASFLRADRLGLPDAVAEEGAARLVEAYAKAGDKEKARAAAARYARRFPDGAKSESVAAWLDL